jgi:hypothetical protein
MIDQKIKHKYIFYVIYNNNIDWLITSVNCKTVNSYRNDDD